MKKYTHWSILFSILIVIIFLIFFRNSETVAIEIYPTEVLIGSIESGSSISKAIKLTNTGTKDIDYLTVKSSCGCTLVSQPPKLIEVGKSTIVDVHYTAKSKLGSFQEIALVSTKDKNYEIPVIGNVTKTISIEPSTLLIR